MPSRIPRWAPAALVAGVLCAVGTTSCELQPFPAVSRTSLGADVELAAGHYAVRVDAESLELTFERDGDVLLGFPRDGFALGRVDALDELTSYDPYPAAIDRLGYRPPAGLRWLAVQDATLESQTHEGFTLALEHDEGRRSRLEVSIDREGSFGLSLTPDEDGDPIAFLRLRPRVDGAEGFYGLGEVFDHVNHRGLVRAMQLEPDGEIESTNNEAHAPVPLLIGTRGWGIFVRSPYPAAFDVASQKGDLVEITFGTGKASTEGLTFHLLGAEHPLDITKHYYELTGFPRLPARWALGPWIWRDENDDQAQVVRDLQTIRDEDLATTGVWIDRPYATAVNSFDFNEALFPDPESMIGLATELGFKMALWHTPYLDEQHGATAALVAEAEAGGYYPLENGLLLNKWGRPIDFTHPGALAFWQALIRRYTDMGIVGFKLDYGEDVVPSLLGGRNVWRFADGSDERTMHARYTEHYHRAYAETLPDDGGFLLCRAATYGDQTNGVIIWPGDLDANFARHRDEVDDDGDAYVAVGGLPASLIGGLSLGPSGFAFYASDTGGYRHSPPDKETFIRWFEQTALSTVMQVGTSTNDVAWEFTTENGFDPETLDLYRQYARLHLRLWPMLWTYASRLAEDGRAIARPLGLAYPELGVHPDDIYLLGDDLLVAPVVARGERTKQVVFPPGTWLDFWTGEPYAGGHTVEVDAPLDVLPLYVRGGGIVPMLRPTIDTLNPVDDPLTVDSYAAPPNGRGPGLLYVLLAPNGEGSMRLFDGTELELGGDASRVVVQVASGSEFDDGFVLEVLAHRAPTEVLLDGAPITELSGASELELAAEGFVYDAARGGTVHVRLPPGRHDVTLTMSP